jgi:hypothetical protein
MTDLLAGQVQVMFDNIPTSIQYIRAGKLRPLAVTSTARSELLPDLPTVGDFLPGYEASAWYGLGVPNGTPPEIVDKLNKETNAILADPKVKARFADLGATLLVGSPADFGKLVASIRRECTDHLLVFNVEHLRRILSKYASYYNEARTHVSLGKDAPCRRPIEQFGDIVAYPTLGGLHHRYARI